MAGTNKLPPEKRRRSERLHHEVPVAYRSDGSFFSDWATDISRSGLFINTRSPLPVGTVLKLIVQLPGATAPFDVMGRVARVVPFDGGRTKSGMGVEFTGLEPARLEDVERYVEKLRKDLGV